MDNSIRCYVCLATHSGPSTSHHPSKCPQLHSDLSPGFYSGGRYDDGEEEDSLVNNNLTDIIGQGGDISTIMALNVA